MTYLDYAATSPLREEVLEIVTHHLGETFGNPSSTYGPGKSAKLTLLKGRREFADTFDVDVNDIYFTSGATEANNWAIQSQAYQARRLGKGNHIVATAIEHPSVAKVLAHLEEDGFEVTYLNPNQEGEILPEDFLAASRATTIGWVAMAVNNELGTILPVFDLGVLAEERGYWFHVDTVQAVGHLNWDFASLKATSFVGSGHKFYAPKGVGFLIYRPFDSKMTLLPLLHGGGQERHKRSGTENVPYIIGMTKALVLMQEELDELADRHKVLKDYLLKELDKTGVHYELNGSKGDQVDYITSIWIKGIPASLILIQMDMAGIYVSAGSACSAGSVQPSAVLKAYYPNQSDRWAESIRISFGRTTQKEDIDAFIKVLSQIK